MKKYLFDKIKLENIRVSFVPCREPGLFESLLLSPAYIPFSFKDFLKMLTLTKINKNGEYTIVVSLPLGEENVSFETLLKSFADHINCKDKITITKFYNKAFEIKENAKEIRKLLDIDPKNLLQ